MSQVWRVNLKLAFWKFATFISLNSYLCLIPSLSCRSNVSHIKLTSATCALFWKTEKLITGEAALSVKCLRTWVRIHGREAGHGDKYLQSQCWGGGDKLISDTHWLASLAKSMSSSPMRDPVSNTRWMVPEKEHLRLHTSACLHIGIRMSMYSYT